MALRPVYWLRHPIAEQLQSIPASPMGEVRRALGELDALGLDIWSRELPHTSSPLKVDSTGQIFIQAANRLETTHREAVFDETLDLLGPFHVGEGKWPDLVSPRPHLRIVPGNVSGEPHVMDSRITTQAVVALFERFGDIDRVVALYPEVESVAVRETIDLERQLAAQVDVPLDHNFPVPILECLDEFIPEVNLIPLRTIDTRLPLLDDRDLLIALQLQDAP